MDQSHPHAAKSGLLVRALLGCSLVLFAFLGIVLILDLVLLAAGIPLTAWNFWAALLGGAGVALVLLHRLPQEERTRGMLAGLLLLASLVLAGWVNGLIYDTSYDGTAYHQEAVIQLTEGWNPIREPVRDEAYHATLLQGYPKAGWLIAATIAKATGDRQTAKVFHWILCAATFAATWAVLLVALPQLARWRAGWVALLAAFHPVFIYQSLSFLVDGDLALCLIAMLGYVCIGLCSGRTSFYWAAGMPAILAVNLKATGAIYVLLLLAGAAGIGVVLGRRHEARALLRRGSWICAAGILLFGYNPYVTNTIHFSHPLYPVMGPHKVECIGCFEPQDVRESGRFSMLLTSLLSEATARSDGWHRKWPFQLSFRELGAFQSAGVRTSGFGPFFTLALMLAAMVSVALCVFVRSRRLRSGIVLAVAVLFFTTMVNPKPWSFRYVPQLFLVALLPATLGLVYLRRPLRSLAYAVLGILSVNLVLISSVYYPMAVHRSVKLNEQLDFMSTSSQPTFVFLRNLYTYRLPLRQRGIHYRLVENRDQLPCPEPAQAGHFFFCNEGYEEGKIHSRLVQAVDALVARVK